MFGTAARRCTAMRESEIEAYLVKRVEAMGGAVRKVSWPGRRGAPDRLVMLPAAECGGWILSAGVIWVELKQPGKKPRVDQLAEHALLRSYGQRVEVIDSLKGVDDLLS